jgi:hypothetical protein
MMIMPQVGSIQIHNYTNACAYTVLYNNALFVFICICLCFLFFILLENTLVFDLFVGSYVCMYVWIYLFLTNSGLLLRFLDWIGLVCVFVLVVVLM